MHFPPEGVSVYLLWRDVCLRLGGVAGKMCLADGFICAVGRIELPFKNPTCLCSSSPQHHLNVTLRKRRERTMTLPFRGEKGLRLSIYRSVGIV